MKFLREEGTCHESIRVTKENEYKMFDISPRTSSLVTEFLSKENEHLMQYLIYMRVWACGTVLNQQFKKVQGKILGP